MKGKIAIAMVAAALLGYVAATPYITAGKIGRAVEQKDAVALAELVDFPAVRASLKEQMKVIALKEYSRDAETAADPFAAVGIAFVTALVDEAVDAFVTPSGVANLATLNIPEYDPKTGKAVARAANSEPIIRNHSMSYDSINRFSIKIEDRHGVEGELLLRRSGLLGWKLGDVRLQIDGDNPLLVSLTSDNDPPTIATTTEAPAPVVSVNQSDEIDSFDFGPKHAVTDSPGALEQCIDRNGETMIGLIECSSEELDRQDERLNIAYQRAMSFVENKDRLRKRQREWIKFRDSECAEEDDGGSAEALNHVGCLSKMTSERADELESLI